jgi:cytochrome P450
MKEEDRPQCPVDHHSAAYAAQARELHDRLRSECPVAWSPAHGGFWFATRYEDVKTVLRQPDLYSSGKVLHEDGTWTGGMTIPSLQHPPFIPLEIDPPKSSPFRTEIMRWMRKADIDALRPRLNDWVDQCLDRVAEANRMDMVDDIGTLPAYTVTLILGLDPALAPRIAWPFYAMDRVSRESAEWDSVMQEQHWLLEYVQQTCLERRENPQDDNISSLVTMEIEGALVPIEDCVWTVMTVIGGGVNTTTQALTHCISVIDANPELRTRLLADPDAIPKAVEEMIRLFPPIWQVNRNITAASELGGLPVDAGERVMASVLAANYDPEVFPNPHEINIDRNPNRHLTFGYGVHRCVGLEAARVQLELMLRRFLQRFPNFFVLRDQCQRFVESADTDGYIRFPLDLGLEIHQSSGV